MINVPESELLSSTKLVLSMVIENWVINSVNALIFKEDKFSKETLIVFLLKLILIFLIELSVNFSTYGKNSKFSDGG